MYLIADPNVSAFELGRPHAIPKLLKYIFSCHPQWSKKVNFYQFFLIFIRYINVRFS